MLNVSGGLNMVRKKKTSQRKYSKAAGQMVEKEMRAFKKGKAHSGKSHKKVTSRKQAIAIALSKARKKGEKAPLPSKKSKTTKSRRANKPQ